jgi:hypothetical protein
LLKENLITLRE